MVQQVNFLQNYSFVNLTQLPLLCEKTGALPRSYDRQDIRQTKMLYCKVRNFIFCIMFIWFLKCGLGISNRFLALIKLYHQMYCQFFQQILLQCYIYSGAFFTEAIHFLVDSYYYVPPYLMIKECKKIKFKKEVGIAIKVRK